MKNVVIYSLPVFILCTLLQAGNDGIVPPRIPERQPIVQPTPAAPVIPAPSPTTPVAAPPSVPLPTPANQLPKQLQFQNGVLELPRYNRVVLSATERAVLTSLQTEQRDAAGNILQDNEGNPVMIPITLGMSVFKGQVLGSFDDRKLRSALKINQAELEVAKAEQAKNLEVRVAAESLLVAMSEVRRLDLMNQRLPGTAAAAEVEKAKLVQAQADANLELQKYIIEEVKTREVTVQENKLEQTQVEIGLRKLTAQIDGIIVSINAAEGELIREGDPVLEIVQLETLWVRVQVSANEYGISDLDGRQAVVHVPLPNGKIETFQGTVFFCDPTIKAGSDMFEVYVEVQNRRVGNYWLLQPGRKSVNVVIPL